MTTQSPSIVFAGGGSAGHVTPAIAIAEAIRAKNSHARCTFVCSEREDEHALLRAAGFEFCTLTAPKFPRGLSLRLLIFPFLFPLSLVRSWRILRELKPDIVVSKGGFVSVPLCIVAHIQGIPIVLHCSDSVPSMSDRLLGSLSKRICTGFPVSSFPMHMRHNAVQTGNPVRAFIAQGSRAAGQRITGFSGKKPVVMIIGGSQGSKALNEVVDASFERLIDLADIIHLTGDGKDIGREHARYFVRSSVTEELPHLYVLADIVITRAGAGVLSELATLKKAAVVVPLLGVAHNHQLRNAEALGSGIVHLPQEKLGDLVSVLQELLADSGKRQALGETLSLALPGNAAERVAEVTLDVLRA